MLKNYSNPVIAKKNTKEYLGNDARLYLSTRKDKKFMVENSNGKFIHFGQMGYEDFTKHKDLKRREAYMKRSTNIKGNWKSDKYSPNNLSINILWKL